MSITDLVKKRVDELYKKIGELKKKDINEDYKQRQLDLLYKAIEFNVGLLKQTGEWEGDLYDLRDYRKKD